MAKDKIRTSIEIERTTWAKFKAQCTLENKTITELIQELLIKYLDNK